jgi:RNA polymerase sigma-70 factor (ECF subfamily)
MSDHRRTFEALALPHLDAAYNLARWLSASSSEAEDIVQDAMLRAFRGFDRFRGEDIRPWILAIVRNCWRSRAAASGRRRHADLADAEALPHEGADPEAQAVEASEAQRLHAAIARLPEEFRTVLVLREMEDLSYREIAEAVDAPIGTVMSRLARARAALKKAWLAEECG